MSTSTSFKPLLDIDAIPQRMAQLENAPGRAGQVWRAVRHLVRNAPAEHPWLVPLVALAERDDAIDESARQLMRNYLAKAETRGSQMYLFNIWCMAFPHARWAIWFDALCRRGVFSNEEAAELAAKFLLIQHRDNHSGLRNKPDPYCADNQAAALCLSSAIIGLLFADGPGDGHLAATLREQSVPRLEAMIGGMPAGGYSLEGSTYHNLIVSFSVPFIVETLERVTGRDLFSEPLKPGGTSAEEVLRMNLRLWMPGRLLLPWDDYGYQIGHPMPLAYYAMRTGDDHALSVLEHVVNWGRTDRFTAGWGCDSTCWTLLYWPTEQQLEGQWVAPEPEWQPWAQKEVGAAVMDTEGSRYLMQMWDATEPMCTRAQVNPNSLVLCADGIPFSADGSPEKDVEPGEGEHVLKFEGATYERNYGPGFHQILDLTRGCGGTHNIILVDHYEAFRPVGKYEHSQLAHFDAEAKSITGDVTGLYRDVYADAKSVLRRSRLVDDSFFVVEDLVRFDKPHTFTSRWYFRPDTTVAQGGAEVRTPEGVALQMRSVVTPTDGADQAHIKRIVGFPKMPDGHSDQVDYHTDKPVTEARWLWVMWPSQLRQLHATLDDGWQARTVARDAGPAQLEATDGQTFDIHPGVPPWWHELPISPSWGYTRTVDVPTDQPWYLRLSAGMGEVSTLWIDGQLIDIPLLRRRGVLLPLDVPCPEHCQGKASVRVTIRSDYPVGHLGPSEHSGVPFDPPTLLIDAPAPERLIDASFADGQINITTTAGKRTIPHDLLP